VEIVDIFGFGSKIIKHNKKGATSQHGPHEVEEIAILAILRERTPANVLCTYFSIFFIHSGDDIVYYESVADKLRHKQGKAAQTMRVAEKLSA